MDERPATKAPGPDFSLIFVVLSTIAEGAVGSGFTRTNTVAAGESFTPSLTLKVNESLPKKLFTGV